MNPAPRTVSRLRDALAARPVRYGLVGLSAAAVLWASVADPPSGGLPPRGPLGFVGADKWLHALTYAALGFGAAYALLARRVRSLVAAALLAATFGAGVEAVQAPLAARTADVADAAANGAGALIGVGIWGLARAAGGRFRDGAEGDAVD